MLELVAFLSLAVSLATGSLAISLASLFDENRAILIIIACSSVIYAFTVLIRLLLFLPFNKYIVRTMNIFFQILTLACSVQYFNEKTKHIQSTKKIDQHLTIAFQVVLLFSLFFNGVFTGCDDFVKKTISESESLRQIDDEKKMQSLDVEASLDDRFIPLKNSTQTLTPDMASGFVAPENRANWVINELCRIKPSDDVSNSSVVRHQLTPIKFSYRSRSSTSNSVQKKPSLKFKSPSFSLSSPFKNRNNQQKLNQLNHSPNNKMNLNSKYVTKLSTISDLPKSFLNMLSNASSTEVNKYERPISTVIEPVHLRNQSSMSHGNYMQPTVQMKCERDAIERMDHTLLPSFLNIPSGVAIDETSPSIKTEVTRPISPLIVQHQSSYKEPIDFHSESSQVTPSIEHDDTQISHEHSLDVMEQTELADISEVPGEYFQNDSYGIEEPVHVELPKNVTLDMWEKDGEKYLERAEGIQKERVVSKNLLSVELENSNKINTDYTPFSPTLKRKNNFIFPLKQIDESPQILQEPKIPQNDNVSTSDAVSELDQYLKELSIAEEDPGYLLEESFRNDYSTSIMMENSYRELNDAANNHSPTKSLVSIISSGSVKHQKSLSGVNNLLHMSTSHVKSNSQISFRFPGNNNNIISASTQSSPIKSNSFKRFSKKLSITNLNDTHSHSRSNDHPFDLHNIYPREHTRGGSVDFSYLHSLQNQHSPSKSVSTANSAANSSRRNSTLYEPTSRNVSRLLQNRYMDNTYLVNSEDMFNVTLKQGTELSLTPAEPTSDESAIDSQESGPTYPEGLVGEYDREKWNTLKNLHLINSNGEIASETEV
ncbi:hypothetical protein C6P45_003655 [Maudiozyma exigua]|uniref:Uncharacterized protein n=1 Tax=Maudiozyma exigua TaxID=34358 RepID=A0A9P6WFB8_MAUEX|nr:hypothetical protein C6P45_003655 [Kazachstania exigua]